LPGQARQSMLRLGSKSISGRGVLYSQRMLKIGMDRAG